MILQNSFPEKQLTDFVPSSQKINDVGFLFPVTLGYLCMKMDFFQIKVGTSLSGEKACAKTERILHIHASWNFLITIEMYNVFKSKYAVRLLLEEMRGLCRTRRLSFAICCNLLFPILLTSALHFPRQGEAGPVGQSGSAPCLTLCTSSSPQRWYAQTLPFEKIHTVLVQSLPSENIHTMEMHMHSSTR